MEPDLRDSMLEAMEAALDAQLRAVRRLRKGEEPERPKVKRSRSQVDLAYDILRRARKPLHIGELLDRIDKSFGVQVDRESLVSSLTKKVVRGDRFVRTDKNTFGLREDVK